ncbi:hypothetical protein GGS20DRAFT_527728 [Poronia punctata]|nr:hypothetical protein GGS20DRAFT_527728 [Poronia punctata]
MTSPITTSTYAYQSPYKPTPTSTHLDRFIRWLRLQKYRIEVTYGVYVFTPGEKVVFWSIFFFFFALVSTAVMLYTTRTLRALTGYIDMASTRTLVSYAYIRPGEEEVVSSSSSSRGLLARNSQVA